LEKIIWTNSAKRSLRHIWQLYAEINADLADKIIREILEGAEKLVFLEQYQVEETLRANYRRIIIRHFKIIYRPLGNGILVLQVFDTRQNPRKHKI
jgi:plasmid stabilization system protein ParE